VDNDCTNVVGMGFELSDLFRRVVVIDSELEVVRSDNDPVLASDETTGADGNIGNFEGFDDGLPTRLVRVHWG
jgi:hypothetical protein